MHTTNYYNTFILIAEDSPVAFGEIPPLKKEKSLANLQYELIHENPYSFTSDEILFSIFAIRNGIAKSELDSAREKFFSKGQPCLRSSPLAKRYGWGIHSNDEGKVAIFGSESTAYMDFLSNEGLKKVRAMRSKRA